MLRKHEIDLIAGLVEGDLQDESEAHGLIERSEEARAEYEAQKVAYEALSDSEPVFMTESEKATLHRDLWTALREDPRPTSPKAPWYYRLAPVAAALFVIIGLGAVLTQGVLNQQSGDDAATVETFAEASEGLSAETAQADRGGTDEAAVTTEATSEDGADGAVDLADEEAAPMAPLLQEAFTEVADAVRTRSNMGDAAAFRPLGAVAELEDAAACLDSAGLPNYSILGEFEDPSGGESTYLVVVQSNDEVGPDTQVVFIDTGSCQIAHVDG
jgi:hypothetical protein